MTVQLEFLGAAGGVTGSRTLLRYAGRTILVDCGLFQGRKEIREMNRVPLVPQGVKIDAVVLTHAHLDHSGYLPRLYNEGYRGPIFCSEGTYDLLPILLMDAAHLEEEFARYANTSGYSHHKPAKPLFTRLDVENVLVLVKPWKRGEWHQLFPNVSVKLFSAGHIIGASSIQFSLSAQNGVKVVTFSGDVGHPRSFTLKGPETLPETDVLILESTYGDRLHERNDTIKDFAEIANRTFERSGTLVIPAFAVGRAQEMLYIIRICEDRGLIPKVPVTLDSPMSNEATRIFFRHPEDHKEGCLNCDDPSAMYLPEHFSNVTSPEDSMLVGMRDGPGIVISAAGMLNGGRILHHLKAKLPDEKNTVLFCGYQAEGTKGRFLQDNAGSIDKLRIHHVEVPIEAEIATISSLSAHGDWQDIQGWLRCMLRPPVRVLLNHGDPEAMTAMAMHVKEVFPTADITPVLEPMKISV